MQPCGYCYHENSTKESVLVLLMAPKLLPEVEACYTIHSVVSAINFE
jgi:hypothetical protein